MGLLTVTNVFPFGAVEIKNEETNKDFKVNRHRLKHFYDRFQEQTMKEVALQMPPT